MSLKSVVIITKFDNPHQFWFRRQENEQQRILLEESWTQSMRNVESFSNFKAQIGMKVLVKNGNFKRAIVENIVCKEYSCWLIDEGINITTDRVYQINMNMASNAAFAIRGGLNNIVAMETRYDFVTFKQQAHFTKFWVQGSIKVCQNLISEATSIVFIKETAINGVEFGQLLLTDKSGIPTSLIMELVEKRFATIDAARFHKEITLEEEDTGCNVNDTDDCISMVTTPVWNTAGRCNRPDSREFEVSKPSGLNEAAINDWLTKTELAKDQRENTSTPLDSDDSSKPPSADTTTTIKPSVKSTTESRLQNLLKQHRMHKYSLNVSDETNIQTSSGTISKSQQTSENISPKSAQIVQSGNPAPTEKLDYDWAEFDSSIIALQQTSPIKNKTPFDTTGLLPAGFNMKDRMSSKSDNSAKSRRSTDNSSSFDRPVNPSDQRRSADSYQFDRRPQSQQNKQSDKGQSNDSSSSANPTYQKPAVDSTYQLDRRPKFNENNLSDRSNIGQCNDSSSNGKLVNTNNQRRSADSYQFDKEQPQLNKYSDKSNMGQSNDSSSDGRPVNPNYQRRSANSYQFDKEKPQLNKYSDRSNTGQSNDKSSFDGPVNINYQRRSADSYQFDKERPQANKYSDKPSLGQSNDSSSYGRPVNTNYQRRSADSYQFDKEKPQLNKYSARSNTGQSNDSSSFDGPVNTNYQRRSDGDSYQFDRRPKSSISCQLNKSSNIASSSFDRSVNVERTADARVQEEMSLRFGVEKRKDDSKNMVKEQILDSDCSSLNTSGQSRELAVAEDPAYDSWDENIVDVEISAERLCLEKRPASISSATSSTNRPIQKQLPSETQPNQQTLSTSSTTDLNSQTSPLNMDNNSQIVDTNKTSLNNNFPPYQNIESTPKYTPEVLKCMDRFACSCSNCKAWKECEGFAPDLGLTFADDLEEAKDKKTLPEKGKVAVVREVKPEPLFYVEGDGDNRKNLLVETVLSTQEASNVEGSRMKRNKIPPVLVHCTVIPTPAPTLTAVPGFVPSVVEALRLFDYCDAKPVQVYGWPAATSGEHVLLVGGPNTGKTLTHVPTVASAILGGMVRDSGREKWGREREPTVIILCAGSKKSDEIYDLYYKLVGKCDKYRRLNIALAIPPLDKQYQDQFKNKIDILVTTPIILCKLISTVVLNVKSLNILILEDLDILLTRFQKEMAVIEHIVTAMLDKRTFGESVQLFMTSEHWTGVIHKFLNRLNTVPFICISDPMETAFYGKAKAHIHMVDSVGKSCHLKDLIQDNCHLYKTIVVCNTVTEVKDIEAIFRLHAVSFTTATADMDGQEIINVEVEWCSTIPGDHKVLLCDDSSLMNYFSIRNATTLIHYSLPPISWKMFTQRFRCLFDSYSSPLVPQTNKASSQIHIYIDDKCQKQLSRLTNCFKEMGVIVPQAFVDMAERAHNQSELLKLTTSAPICAHLKLTGQCLTPTTPCHHRHIFDYRVDRSKQKYGHLPKQGPVKFRLLRVVDPTTYFVRVLSETGGYNCGKRGGGSDGGDVDKEYGELVVEMQMALRIEGNRVRPQQGAKVGKCYILEERDKSLRRCRVTKIIDSDRITSLPSVVEVFMLDDGVVHPKVAAALLFNIPKNMKRIPYLAVEVRLANIVPPGRDNAFSLKILADVKHLLEKHTSNTPTATASSTPHYYTGVVQLQLGNCLWLHDVRLMRYLRKSDIHLTSLILKNEMVGNFWGEVDETPMKRLRELCTVRQISVPDISESKVIQKTQVIEQVSPQWAFLETNTWNKVNYSAGEQPDCIYVNLDKFKKQLSDLHAFILQQIKRPFYPCAGEITPGRFYLAPDSDQENTDMCRVLVIKIIDEKNDSGISTKLATCFFVDYGNTEVYKAEKLIYLRDDMISLLPFQAIECSFYGFKYPNSIEVNTKVINVVEEYILENETDFFRNWYIRAMEKHTVYTACNYLKNNDGNAVSKGKPPNKNAISRFTYSIYAYLENESEIFSLNCILGENVSLGLQYDKNMDNLEELEEQLLDMIVRDRRARDSDEDGDMEGAGQEVAPRMDHLNGEILQQFNSSPEETNGERLQNSINHCNFDDFNEDDDIQIIDKGDFIKQMRAMAQPKQTKPFQVPAIAENNNSIHSKTNNNHRENSAASSSANGYTPMVALPVKPTDGVRTPEVVWHQTGSHIVIEVNVPAVQQYKMILVQGNRMMFSATTTDNKKYSSNLKFFQSVEDCKHKALGLCVHIKLKKLEEVAWPRLLFNKQKQSNIKYNVFKIEPEYDDDDEDKPRKSRKKFLDLGPEFADIQEPDQYWYNEDSDYNNSESDYAAHEFED